MIWQKIKNRINREVLDPTRVGVLDQFMSTVRKYEYRNQNYRPVFIAGTTGGGTTVLAMLMRQNLLTAGLVAESALQLPPRSPLRINPMKKYKSILDYRKGIDIPENCSKQDARKDYLEMYRIHTRHPVKNIIDKGPNVNLVRAEFLQQCFPDSLFILLLRDPVACIEGMRRKWPLFGNAPLHKAIDFYEDIHTKFLESADNNKINAILVEYKELVCNSDSTLNYICKHGKLILGETESYYEERPNRQGQGVRNVTNGKVKVVHDADSKAYAKMTDEDIDMIKNRLDPLSSSILGLLKK